MKYWYAVQAKPRQENTAEENLRRQGFDTYLPKIQLRRRRRDKWTKVVEPLFPRYLFIHLEPGVDNWAPLRSTLGVSTVVRFGVETPEGMRSSDVALRLTPVGD